MQRRANMDIRKMMPKKERNQRSRKRLKNEKEREI